jgi:divinyl chlorophyllide a 8-vinyl-reductase
MASRTGAPDDAWAVDYRAHVHVLDAARRARRRALRAALGDLRAEAAARLPARQARVRARARRVGRGVLDRAPTAFFKSLSGQVERVRRGKPFLVFGDGTLTACKPISDGDLAEYLAGCLDDPSRRDRCCRSGGPGAAITPREQGEQLFALLGRPPRFARVPVRLLDAAAGALGALARVAPPLAAKAELARIGRYYATESMLVWDERAQRYDADATPSFGRETLADHYRALLRGEAAAGLGAHAVF